MLIIKSSFKKVKSALRRDPEIAFLLFTAFFLVISIQLYNVLKNEKKSNFFEILNNSFLKKNRNILLGQP